ncbi:hypothetical protein BCF33_1860 [Hasllibacter halocynthiae]|uniref:Uncharacterized protein n=1 Tax=Hasllibacter halocynthiae TaxID=595589 RepID=A0A2T0X219_9RHOB|nr:hypothetical protein [Hasllibacter halocynthiae]PRY92996.1 hypothetical protein BCF33_1860 [Hasllibacter halocynthiae]
MASRILTGASLGALFGALLAGPAAAQEFEVPEGCELQLTVQGRECAVTQYFICEEDPEGFRRSIQFREDGATGASVVDAEYQWVQTIGGASRERLVDAEDPASLSELFETGEDSFDFTLQEDGPRGTNEYRVVGIDRLEGGEVEIDGVPLQRTIFAYQRLDEDGEALISVTGEQYVSEDLRLFFAGPETARIGGRVIESDNSPVRFAREGDPGFGDIRPAFGCDVSDIGFRP